jgi:predicted NACHT family NTPase
MDTPADFDINQVIAEVINSQIESIYERVKATGIKGIESLRIRLKSAYTQYLKKIHNDFSKARSFFLRDVPAELYSFYVPAGVSSGKVVISSVTARSLENIGKRVIVCGLAGCGKSMLMRHLLVNSINDKFKVPVFCELKELNDKDATLVSLVEESLKIYGLKLHEEVKEAALEKGHFLFLLDGYDEIDPNRRIAVVQQVSAFAKSYPECQFVVTSRPDPELSGWDGFTKAEVSPLSLEQCCELVEKLPVEEKLKELFVGDLKSHLYRDHTTFLSNPLLLTIMLLTYDENAEIPQKLSVFYNQAYEALFQRHDARKRAYKRKRKTTLDIQDFAKIFSAFCLLTYDRRMFKFTESEALDILGAARGIVEINFSAQDYLTDLMQATCLLIEDGLQLTFSHRSFQEYFVARFIHEAPPDKREALIKRYKSLIRRDNTIALLYEMDPHSVERVIIIPSISDLLDVTGIGKGRLTTTKYLRYLRLIYEEIGEINGQITCLINSRVEEKHYYDVVALMLRRIRSYRINNNGVHEDKAISNILKDCPKTANNFGYKTAKIKVSSPLAKLLFKSNHFCGGETLKALLRTYSTIQLKHKNRTESLETLLRTPRRAVVGL